jgi:hypothetical protein
MNITTKMWMAFFGLSPAMVVALAFCFATPARAAEEVCGACDKKVVVVGQYQHGTSDTFLIENAPGNEAAFRDEITGADFTVMAPGLKAGKYTVEIGLAELQFEEAGRRLFDIVCGSQVIATNLDIFKAAGGMNKVIRIHAEVDHAEDTQGGPLSVRFLARRDEAKLNTFEVKDGAGTSIVYMKV